MFIGEGRSAAIADVSRECSAYRSAINKSPRRVSSCSVVCLSVRRTVNYALPGGAIAQRYSVDEDVQLPLVVQSEYGRDFRRKIDRARYA